MLKPEVALGICSVVYYRRREKRNTVVEWCEHEKSSLIVTGKLHKRP